MYVLALCDVILIYLFVEVKEDYEAVFCCNLGELVCKASDCSQHIVQVDQEAQDIISVTEMLKRLLISLKKNRMGILLFINSSASCTSRSECFVT